MRTMIGMGMAAAALALAGCGDGGSNAPTAEENAQLDEAANMLDASPDSLTVENPELGNGDVPAAQPGDVLVGGGDEANAAANGAAPSAGAPDATNAQ